MAYYVLVSTKSLFPYSVCIEFGFKRFCMHTDTITYLLYFNALYLDFLSLFCVYLLILV